MQIAVGDDFHFYEPGCCGLSRSVRRINGWPKCKSIGQMVKSFYPHGYCDLTFCRRRSGVQRNIGDSGGAKMTNVNDIIKKLSPRRRRKIAKRAADLIAEHKANAERVR